MHFNFCVQLSSGQVLRGRLTPVRLEDGRISFATAFLGSAEADGRVVDSWYELDAGVGRVRLKEGGAGSRRLREGDTVDVADSSITVS